MVCNDVKYCPKKDADSYYGRTGSEPFNLKPPGSAPAGENADPSVPLPICYSRERIDLSTSKLHHHTCLPPYYTAILIDPIVLDSESVSGFTKARDAHRRAVVSRWCQGAQAPCPRTTLSRRRKLKRAASGSAVDRKTMTNNKEPKSIRVVEKSISLSIAFNPLFPTMHSTETFRPSIRRGEGTLSPAKSFEYSGYKPEARRMDAKKIALAFYVFRNCHHIRATNSPFSRAFTSNENYNRIEYNGIPEECSFMGCTVAYPCIIRNACNPQGLSVLAVNLCALISLHGHAGTNVTLADQSQWNTVVECKLQFQDASSSSDYVIRLCGTDYAEMLASRNITKIIHALNSPCILRAANYSQQTGSSFVLQLSFSTITTKFTRFSLSLSFHYRRIARHTIYKWKLYIHIDDTIS
ncbi:hypothetical protein EAG_01258 [Camponotus floridanus]|uniref:Uncharacterized protein n=1 Tax=Camponotus floridanus TaxID=104421 RepID=E2ALC0_CAMFO|nr:hypothetical protein EAG_01258 [Camponotus floridanus]